MLYPRGSCSWWMDRATSTRWDRGSTCHGALMHSTVWLPLWTKTLDFSWPLTSMATEHCKTWHRCLHVHKWCCVSPLKEVKAIADYKAAWAVQRPFLKPGSGTFYFYTPQTHFCVELASLIYLFKKKENQQTSYWLVREAKAKSISAWMN